MFVAFLAFSAFGCSLDRRGLGGDAALASDATDDVPVPSRDAAEEADTGRDAELDAGDDARVDAGSMDAGWDAGRDGGMDGGRDGGTRPPSDAEAGAVCDAGHGHSSCRG
jgi:hypothetical protein